MENRYDPFIPEKNQLKFLKNVIGVHRYSVNDAVRADFGIFPLAKSGLQASANKIADCPCRRPSEST